MQEPKMVDARDDSDRGTGQNHVKRKFLVDFLGGGAWLFGVLCVAALAPAFVLLGIPDLLVGKAFWAATTLVITLTVIAVVGGVLLSGFLFKRQPLVLAPYYFVVNRLFLGR